MAAEAQPPAMPIGHADGTDAAGSTVNAKLTTGLAADAPCRPTRFE